MQLSMLTQKLTFDFYDNSEMLMNSG